MRSIPLGLCFALVIAAGERLAEDRGAVGLDQAIRQLETNVRVLSVTAHPDDEDAGTLTYLARGRGASLTMLILNRGESGANLVSGDFFEGLGALRTGEMLRAAEHYGAPGCDLRASSTTAIRRRSPRPSRIGGARTCSPIVFAWCGP